MKLVQCKHNFVEFDCSTRTLIIVQYRRALIVHYDSFLLAESVFISVEANMDLSAVRLKPQHKQPCPLYLISFLFDTILKHIKVCQESLHLSRPQSFDLVGVHYYFCSFL